MLRLLLPSLWPALLVLAAQDAPGSHWPGWRGPLSTGASAAARPPVQWSEDEHVRWRAAVPGLGHSTPVVWGDRVFVTSAIPTGDPLPPRPDPAPGAHDNAPVRNRQRFVVVAYSLETGERLWLTEVREALPHEGGHVTASFASASPVCDARRIVASFGSYGVYGLDHDGAVRWAAELGTMHSKHGHGEGASPVLFGDTVVVPWDHEGPSALVALDADTGETRWRVEREEPTGWSTPIVVEVDGEAQVVVSGSGRAQGYDLATGAEVWSCDGLSQNVVASPVADGTRVFLGSSYEKQALLALELAGARGDLTTSDEHLLWVRRAGTPYVPSPVLWDGALYVLHHYQGLLSRIALADGAQDRRPLRLGIGDVYGSPIVAGGRLYVTDLDGTTVVLTADAELRPLARNRLNERFSASAVAVGRRLLLRGESLLYCLEDGAEDDDEEE